MSGWIMAGQLILGLSILVGLHEFGHFFFAKLFKIRVNKFYIFFDFLFPLPNVANFSLLKKTVGETEYGLGWFPLGGYVQIAGMVDETQDASKLAAVPEPWEFRSKPAWQRLLVMLGGIIVNIITGIVIFVTLSYQNGYNYISVAEINKNGVAAGELAQAIGLKNGDKILKVNGKTVEDFRRDVIGSILVESDCYYTIERDGKTMEITIPNDLVGQFSKDQNPARFLSGFATLRPVGEVVAPTEKGTITKFKESIFGAKAQRFPAHEAGFQKGDSILAINGKPVTYYHELSQATVESKNKPMEMSVWRRGQVLTLKPVPNEAGKLLFSTKQDPLQKISNVKYNFTEALAAGTANAFDVITKNIQGFAKIFRGDVSASDALSGPVGIAKLYGSTWDWGHFWAMTGLLSMALAFMNALPIPALDGGHVIFLLYEMIFRRPPPEKVLDYAQQVGTVLLLALMAFAIGNDFFK